MVKKTQVTVTALPRQGYRGFGAIAHYFLSGIPEVIEVTDAEYEELHEDPATYFLKVEDGDTTPEPEAAPAKSSAKPGDGK